MITSDDLRGELRDLHRKAEPEVLAPLVMQAKTGPDERALILSKAQRLLVDLRADFQAGFLALGCPRSFVYGERNFPQGPQTSADIPDPAALRAAGVTPLIMPGTGHEMMLADAAAFAALVAQWRAAAV